MRRVHYSFSIGKDNSQLEIEGQTGLGWYQTEFSYLICSHLQEYWRVPYNGARFSRG